MTYQGQVFGVTTYDALFKCVLSEDRLRPSFFDAFLPGIHVESSQRIDHHMNPLQELQNLRPFLGHQDSKAAVDFLNQNPKIYDELPPKIKRFLKGMADNFDDFKYAFPQPKYKGTMDFACQLDNGEYTLIEMQVAQENDFDRRALAYIAAFYGGQVRQGDEITEIKRVLGINILGGGSDGSRHWRDAPQEFVRHYKLQDQLNDPNNPHYLDGLELIQYSIMNAPEKMTNRAQQDWITFYKRAHHMTDDDVKKNIETPAVLEAFDMIRLSNLPEDVRIAYSAQEREYAKYSNYTESLKEEAREEIRAQMNAQMEEVLAREKEAKEKTHQMIIGMLGKGMADDIICQIAGISQNMLDELKKLEKE